MGTHWVATRLTADRDSVSRAEAGGLAPHALAGTHCFRSRPDPRSIRLPKDDVAESRGDDPHTRGRVPSVFKAASSPARFAPLARRRKREDSNPAPRRARIAFQASPVPDGFRFHGEAT